MKWLLAPVLISTCAFVTFASTAAAANMSRADAMKQIQAISGTYACTMTKNNHTATFAPIFNGRAMRVQETAGGGSAELVLFDTHRQKWIDEYVDASGNYSVMEGMPVKGGIDFTTVYPTGMNATLAVRMPSKTTMTTVFKSTMSGKVATQKETCTKR